MNKITEKTKIKNPSTLRVVSFLREAASKISPLEIWSVFSAAFSFKKSVLEELDLDFDLRSETIGSYENTFKIREK